MKKTYDYNRRVYCKEKTDVIAIIIVISKYGKIKDFTELDITYHPQIIKTKLINKQKDLKTIRKKFNDNKVLTSMECSLLIALPLFELKESEAEIVEEICKYIESKKDCIPQDKLEEIVFGMYFNILEYAPKEKHENLMEMISMNDLKSRGDFAKMRTAIKNEGIEEGIKEGIEQTIPRLLDTMTPEDISNEFNISLERVLEIKNSYGK